jgi:predicted XRE-type DNA-binding protein
MTKTRITKGSGNVFADLDVADASSHFMKAELVSRIQSIVTARGLTQKEAAAEMDISQPDVSRMLSGKFRDLSVERLLVILTRLGYQVDIVVKRDNKKAFAAITLDAV